MHVAPADWFTRKRGEGRGAPPDGLGEIWLDVADIEMAPRLSFVCHSLL